MPLKVKVVGSSCSPNSIASCDDVLISLQHFNNISPYYKQNTTTTTQEEETKDSTTTTSDYGCSVDSSPPCLLLPLPSSSVQSVLVSVGGGVTFASLLSLTAPLGWSVPVVGSITAQTIVGAVCTAVHNTHKDFGSICGVVEELEIARMPRCLGDESEVMRCSRNTNSDLFFSLLSGLGSVAVIISAVLKLKPNQSLRCTQTPVSIYSLLNSPSSAIISTTPAIITTTPHTTTTTSYCSSSPDDFNNSLLCQRVRSCLYYRLWLWPGVDDVAVEWSAQPAEGGRGENNISGGAVGRLPPPPAGGGLVDCLLYDWVLPYSFRQAMYMLWFVLLESVYAISNLTGSTSIVRLANWVWYQLLLNKHTTKIVNHSDAFAFDCMFRQEVSEWCLPQDRCVGALRQLSQLLRDNPQWAVHPPIEVRFTGADDAWLSPSYGRESCWIGVVMYRSWGTAPPHYWGSYLRVFCNIMHLAGGRPHWAKCNPSGDTSSGGSTDYKQMYPMYSKWRDVRQVMDPERMLVTPFVEHVLDETNDRKQPVQQKTGVRL
eukprot:GHVS01067771.1.p1 GENE.GHVS01067771.1~~GHVS01067771.1.p1  ORF type:complete len:543 (-),score=84.52 GHVS01067771.1:186-1814(-)